MFQTILLKQDQLIYQIFQYLQIENPCSLDKLCQKLQKTPAALKRYLQNWQKEPLNRATGVGFYLKKNTLRGIYAKEHGQLFFSTLLHRSDAFQLLLKVLDNPYYSTKELRRSMHVSAASFQRRVQQLLALLNHYQLELSFMHTPALKGNLAQIRWLAWVTSLLADPPHNYQSETLFQRYQSIQRQRPTKDYIVRPTPVYYKPPYQLSERGFTFLWQQLTGLEKIWAPATINDTIFFALHAHTTLDSCVFREMQQKFHQIHGLCSFFTGEIVVPYKPLSDETQRLVQSFRLLLPNYNQLLTKHPEIPVLYEYLLTDYRRIQQQIFVAEE
uniref:helix-turn-helix domain-containing protein n=1 Tax=Candidatus Enterococcus willemsii TaxID=1857215 RepID=UPI00403F0947